MGNEEMEKCRNEDVMDGTLLSYYAGWQVFIHLEQLVERFLEEWCSFSKEYVYLSAIQELLLSAWPKSTYIYLQKATLQSVDLADMLSECEFASLTLPLATVQLFSQLRL